MNLKFCFRFRDFVGSKNFRRIVALITLIVSVFAVRFWQPSDVLFDDSENVVENSDIVQIVPEIHDLSSPEAEIQGRNLSEYKFGGRFFNLSEKTDLELLHSAEAFDYARNFILKNFREKKRAYIIYEFSGADMGSDIYYFIEPDKNNVWRVVERWKTSRVRPDSWIHEINESVFYKIKKNPVLKNSDKYQLGFFYLSFLDKDGKKIEIL
jgi:hypothetical protein